MLGASLAIGSSLTGGASDFFGGTTSRKIGTIRFMFASQLIGLGCTAVWVIASGDSPPRLATFAEAAAAGVALAVGLGVFLQALVVGTMSIVAPVSATGVVIPIAAGIAQGNHVAASQAIGIVIAVAGIVLVSRSPQQHPSASRGSGLQLALLSALGVGAFFWLMASASRGSVPWASLVARMVPTIAFAAVMCVKKMPMRPLVIREHASATVSAALLGFVSMAMYAFAAHGGELAIVSVLASLFPAVTALLAYFLLRERLGRIQQLGVGAVLVAVALMSSP